MREEKAELTASTNEDQTIMRAKLKNFSPGMLEKNQKETDAFIDAYDLTKIKPRGGNHLIQNYSKHQEQSRH